MAIHWIERRSIHLFLLRFYSLAVDAGMGVTLAYIKTSVKMGWRLIITPRTHSHLGWREHRYRLCFSCWAYFCLPHKIRLCVDNSSVNQKTSEEFRSCCTIYCERRQIFRWPERIRSLPNVYESAANIQTCVKSARLNLHFIWFQRLETFHNNQQSVIIMPVAD